MVPPPQLPYVLIGGLLVATVVITVVLTIAVGSSGLLVLLALPLLLAYLVVDRTLLRKREEEGDPDPGGPGGQR